MDEEPQNTQANTRKPSLTAEMEAAKWQPGQSGNPGGRPKKRPVTSALERLLDDSKAEGIARALIALASGEGKHAVAAAREIMDRLEGKVSLPIEAKLNVENMTDEEMTARIEELAGELGYVKKEKL